jgi:hypothetical protein
MMLQKFKFKGPGSPVGVRSRTTTITITPSGKFYFSAGLLRAAGVIDAQNNLSLKPTYVIFYWDADSKQIGIEFSTGASDNYRIKVKKAKKGSLGAVNLTVKNFMQFTDLVIKTKLKVVVREETNLYPPEWGGNILFVSDPIKLE